MIQISIRKTLLIAILCLLSGIGISRLFINGEKHTGTSTDKIFSSKTIMQKASKIEREHQDKIAQLSKKNEELKRSLTKTSESLIQSKQKISAVEKNIRQLLKSSITSNPLQQMSACDTLQEYTREYINESIQKDSLYNTKIILLENTIAIKDTTLELNSSINQQTKILLNETVLQYSQLETENNTLRVQISKSKRKNKLFAFGLALLSGVAAGYLVTH